MEVTIKAKSSSSPDSFYNVTFTYDESSLKVACDCRAGIFGKFCKHKWQLLGCNYDMLFDQNEASLLDMAADWAQKRGIYTMKGALRKIQDQIDFLEAQKIMRKKEIEQQLKNGF